MAIKPKQKIDLEVRELQIFIEFHTGTTTYYIIQLGIPRLLVPPPTI